MLRFHGAPEGCREALVGLGGAHTLATSTFTNTIQLWIAGTSTKTVGFPSARLEMRQHGRPISIADLGIVERGY